MEHSPYCERDIRPPQDLKTHDAEGDFLIKAKKTGNLIRACIMEHILLM